jgi:hypothetical protein
MPERPERLLTFQVTCTKSDIFRFFRHTSIRTPVYYVAAAGPTAVVYLIFLLTHIPHRPWFTLASYAAFLFVIPRSWARTATKEPGQLEPVIYALSAEGISTEYRNASTGESWKSDVSWALARGAAETKRYIFIRLARDKFQLIPKGQLGADQIGLLRRILRERVTGTVKLL